MFAACTEGGGFSNEKAIVFPGSEWASCGPEEVGMSRDSLTKALGYLSTYCGEDGLSQTMIIKNGYVVFAGEDIDNQHNIFSATKSLTSAALGVLVHEGTVSLDDKAAKYEPLLQELYPDVTLRQFATMTSGYAAKGGDRKGGKGEDWSGTPFVPTLPFFSPGEAFAFWDEAQLMFGRVLTQAAGRDLYEVLDEGIMKPIGVKDWKWLPEDTLTIANGNSVPIRNGAIGIELSAHQLGRVGWLFANHGVWNGDTLLTPAFAQAAMTAQVSPLMKVASTDREGIKGSGVYGFNWWTASPDGGGEARMRNSPSDAAYMTGLNHNICIVIPSQKTVIVRMGEDGNPPVGKDFIYDQVMDIMF
jgi:CubicO group peptidase (beta-lactamase class C family)